MTTTQFTNMTREQIEAWNADAFAAFTEHLQGKTEPRRTRGPAQNPAHRIHLVIERVKAKPDISASEIAAEFGYANVKGARDALRRARVEAGVMA